MCVEAASNPEALKTKLPDLRSGRERTPNKALSPTLADTLRGASMQCTKAPGSEHDPQQYLTALGVITSP